MKLCDLMMISRGHDDRQRDATSVDQQHPLAPIFFPDPWGLARQILAPVELSPQPRRGFASARRCPPCRHTRPAPPATRHGRIPRSPIPGSACVSHRRCRSAPWVAPSMGSPCAAHTRSLRTPCAPPCLCAHRPPYAGIPSCSRVPPALPRAVRPSARTHLILPKRPLWPSAIAVSVAHTRASTGKQGNILFTDKF